MKRPEKKELNLPGVLETLGATEMHEQELINKHYNQGIQDMIDWLPDNKEIAKLLKNTIIGYYQPMGVKGEPTPPKQPLYLHNYKIKLSSIIMLAKAISKRLGNK